MKVKEFIKNNLSYLLALVCILGIIGFLFAPLVTYDIKVDGVKYYYDVSILKALNPSLIPNWLGISFLVFVGSSLILLIADYLCKSYQKVHDILCTINLIFIAFIFANCFFFKEAFAYFAPENIENFHGVSIGWGAFVIVFLSALAFFALISTSNYVDKPIQMIAEDGVLIAAAFVLNFLKLPISATGGSINFQMLPLFIIALRRGPLNAFISCGVVYGLLTCISDGYGFATFPFDYLIGFGSVAVIGFFRPQILNEEKPLWKGEVWLLFAVILSTFVRFVGSTTSSMVIYQLNFGAALLYNAVYIPVSGAIALVVVMFMLPAIKAINRRYPTHYGSY